MVIETGELFEDFDDENGLVDSLLREVELLKGFDSEVPTLVSVEGAALRESFEDR